MANVSSSTCFCSRLVYHMLCEMLTGMWELRCILLIEEADLAADLIMRLIFKHFEQFSPIFFLTANFFILLTTVAVGMV